MSVTMARQGGWVQLEQSDMHLALNMVKLANRGYLRAAIEETKRLIKKPGAEVWEQTKRGVDFPRHQKVKAAMETHPAMGYQNHPAGCLPCQNHSAKNLQTRWRRKATAAPPQELAASPPGTPPAPTSDTEGNERYEIESMPSSCV
jgi:hypothetical protein